ncbi:hypothetical protein CPLU01_06068 [Colletotrichum plurivorum]|uniref:Uncharacterized protein n=1 Tax=Colletotrichum plurivorum TaxID=2175906 RepID=A0A8H6KJJ4_9PEZI|nr:hypothetical protein CPLU01_06068 [Colletotrichum plurivorum]
METLVGTDWCSPAVRGLTAKTWSMEHVPGGKATQGGAVSVLSDTATAAAFFCFWHWHGRDRYRFSVTYLYPNEKKAVKPPDPPSSPPPQQQPRGIPQETAEQQARGSEASPPYAQGTSGPAGGRGCTTPQAHDRPFFTRLKREPAPPYELGRARVITRRPAGWRQYSLAAILGVASERALLLQCRRRPSSPSSSSTDSLSPPATSVRPLLVVHVGSNPPSNRQPQSGPGATSPTVPSARLHPATATPSSIQPFTEACWEASPPSDLTEDGGSDDSNDAGQHSSSQPDRRPSVTLQVAILSHLAKPANTEARNTGETARQQTRPGSAISSAQSFSSVGLLREQPVSVSAPRRARVESCHRHRAPPNPPHLLGTKAWATVTANHFTGDITAIRSGILTGMHASRGAIPFLVSVLGSTGYRLSPPPLRLTVLSPP